MVSFYSFPTANRSRVDISEPSSTTTPAEMAHNEVMEGAATRSIESAPAGPANPRLRRINTAIGSFMTRSVTSPTQTTRAHATAEITSPTRSERAAIIPTLRSLHGSPPARYETETSDPVPIPPPQSHPDPLRSNPPSSTTTRLTSSSTSSEQDAPQKLKTARLKLIRKLNRRMSAAAEQARYATLDKLWLDNDALERRTLPDGRLVSRVGSIRTQLDSSQVESLPRGRNAAYSGDLEDRRIQRAMVGRRGRRVVVDGPRDLVRQKLRSDYEAANKYENAADEWDIDLLDHDQGEAQLPLRAHRGINPGDRQYGEPEEDEEDVGREIESWPSVNEQQSITEEDKDQADEYPEIPEDIFGYVDIDETDTTDETVPAGLGISLSTSAYHASLRTQHRDAQSTSRDSPNAARQSEPRSQSVSSYWRERAARQRRRKN